MQRITAIGCVLYVTVPMLIAGALILVSWWGG